MSLLTLVSLYVALIFSFFKLGQWNEKRSYKRKEQEKMWQIISNKFNGMD